MLAPVGERDVEIRLGTSRIHLHEAPRSGYLARVSESLHRPDRRALLALEFSVGSREAAAEVLRANDISFECEHETIFVEPEMGFGTGIAFVQAR